ncbi:MAG TPA: hypothetical protein VG479_05485 [Gaiellaceae bacterium]|nr:hypothetical protein [Gaiellaceae bacterium]
MIGPRALLGVVALTFASALGSPSLAAADIEDETALAERFAPVVRLVEQPEECGPGEPFMPTDIDALLGDETVALRGPWNRTDLIEIGPTADDLVGRFEYHLDFPGDPLDPGCDYQRWAHHLTEGSEPVVYAHVATEPAYPDKLALQYWFFYPFNDFNNKHEGDWEMIQLVFDAGNAAEALDQEPVEVGYSAHEGAERSEWDDERLELVDGTHPVVYPAAGSHANKFGAALWLGSSAEAGVGCDDTTGPHLELAPEVATIPTDPAAAEEVFPWIAFEGRWGELQKAFFNGPTGPNLKTQWTEPITWSEDWRARSYAVPTGGTFGTSATDFFCSAVATGSKGLILLLRSPVAVGLFLTGLVALLVFAAVRATWLPTAPLRLARTRSWGQILSASGRMYLSRARLFLGLGLLLIPITVLITGLQWLLLAGVELLGDGTGEGAGLWAFVSAVIGTAFALLGLALVQAATACALVEMDAGRRPGPVEAYRLALGRIRPLLGSVGIFVLMWVVLAATVVLIPVGIFVAVRWCLLAPVVELEGRPAWQSLRRSRELVYRHWFKVASLVGVSAASAFLLGPLLGAILIFVTDTPLATLNVIAGVVYALALPFVALVTAYVYFDARTRVALQARSGPDELPAEVEVTARADHPGTVADK